MSKYKELLEHEGERLDVKRRQLDEIEAVLKRSGYRLEDWAQFLNWRDKQNGGNCQGTNAELLRLADIDCVPLRWLWPGKIPMGKLTLLVGDPGLGKGIITLDFAARVTIGADWPDGGKNAESGDVIILSAEDDPGDTIRPRLEIGGADLDRIFILKCVRRKDGSRRSFSLTEDLIALRDCLTENVRLIIIDPISAYLGDTDSHVNTSVRAVLAPLAELAASSGVATLGVSHLNKGASAAIYRIQGSIAFTAAARAVWAVGKDPRDETGHRRLLLPIKCNLAADTGGLSYELENCGGQATVHWGEAVTTDASDALYSEQPEVLSEQQQAETTLWRVGRRMKIQKERSGFQGAVIWSLPDGPIDSKNPIDSIDSYPGKYGIYGKSGMYGEDLEDGQMELIDEKE